MPDTKTKPAALIVGTGAGLSASFARQLSAAGYALHLTACDISELGELAAETGATLHQLDSTDADATASVIAGLPGELRVALHNPWAHPRGAITDLDPQEVRKAIEITAWGAFTMGQAAAKRMLAQSPDNNRLGTILFTGASTGVKGYPLFVPFVMGRFAQRGLAQSMARELHPKGIHVCWINVDGFIRSAGRPEQQDADGNPVSMLDPDAIAREYMHLIGQDRTAWSEELSLRPWDEKF